MFDVQPIAVDSDKLRIMNLYRGKIAELGDFIESNIPESRERSLAMTKLQECLF